MKLHSSVSPDLPQLSPDQQEINLIIKPQQAGISKEIFLATHPDNSLGLDGYIAQNSFFEQERAMGNRNHHEQCNREKTPATCEQALQDTRNGFLLWFYRNQLNLFVNDCDQDVSTAVFVYEEAPKIQKEFRARLNHIVGVIGKVDRLGGTYYPRDPEDQQVLAWLFDHYSEFRRSGGLNRQNPTEYKDVIDESKKRLSAYLLGQHKKIPVDLRYERMIDGVGWSMIREIGAQGRFGAIQDGVNTFVAYSERKDGRHNYAIGKTSSNISINLPKLYAAFNEAEKNPADPWGGSDLIGGSPRCHGSKLTPAECTEIINDQVLKLYKRFFQQHPSSVPLRSSSRLFP